MARIICVASGKGGAGKTTTVSNLSAALAKLGKSVIAVDCNLTTSNLGIHFGVPTYPVTLQDVLKKKAELQDAMYYHPGGFRVVPADMSLSKSTIAASDRFLDVFYQLAYDAEFVLVDSAAGLGREAINAVKASDEMITVTNPELPALVDALKLVRIADKNHTQNLGIVLNRVRGHSHEISHREVESFLGMPIIGIVNEDTAVRKATAMKEPVVLQKPRSLAAKQFGTVAARLIGRESRQINPSPVHRLFGWLG
jgi:cell division ATPase MinD